MIGQTVDQYKILESLGRNPVSETFLAEHAISGERFVLKMVTPQLLVLAGFKDRLIADASAMIDWHHPRVMPLENILDESGRLFLVQRFVECTSLAKAIRAQQQGSFPIEGFQTIASDILNGLEFLHKQGMVPRFFNPRKIMVTPDNRAFIRVMGKELPKALETYRKKQNLVPAARFYAPERFENQETQDVRHNIYSMGIVLFQMATGKIPYGGKSFEELQKRHSSSRIPSPQKVNPEVPAELSDAILKAMSKRPEDRFQSVEELANALGVEREELGAGTVANSAAAAGMLEDEPNFGMDLMSEQEASALGSGDDFGSNLDLNAPAGDDFDFGGDPSPGNDDFDLGGSPPASGGDDFGFGADAPAGGGDDFGFGADAPAGGGDDFGFGGDAPNSGGDDFDFGGETPASGGDDFGFGGDAPSSGGDDFDFAGDAPAGGDDFQFSEGSDLGEANFDFPQGGGQDLELGAPTIESDVFNQASPSGSAEVTLGELDNHDPSVLEAAFERELGKEDPGPFSSLDMEAPDDDDPFAALGLNRNEPAPPGPTDENFDLGNDLDATNPDSGIDFGHSASGDDLAPPSPEGDAFGDLDAADPGKGSGFEFGGLDETGGDDFGFGSDTPEPAPAGGDDFAFGDAPAGGDEFGFGNDAPSSGGDEFGFGNDTPSSGGDEFGFGDDAPAGGGDEFGFGDDAPAGGGDDFGFGDAPAGGGDDFGFGDAPAGGGDDFGFGSDAPAGGDDFGFGNDAPAGGGDEFGFGNDAPAGGDDFGFGDDAPAGGGDDFGFGNDAPASGGDDFGFGDDAPASGGDDFGFESPSSGGGDDFNFGDTPAGGDDFGFESEAPADSGDGFDFGESAPASGGDEFGFGDSGGEGFDFGDQGNDDTFGLGAPSSPANDAFDFESNQAPEVDEFGLEIEAPPGQGGPPPPPPPTSSESLGGTEDGAFSFEAMDQETPPPPVPEQGDASAAGLASSLAAAEAETDQKAAKPKKPKVVRRFDMKVIGVTAALAIIVIGALGFWFVSSKNKKHEQMVMQGVQELADARRFDEATQRIQDELAKGPSSSLERQLKQMASNIRQDREEVQNQVDTLISRAIDYERDGKVLVDGKNDALGSYQRALAKDPGNTSAREAMDRIKAEKAKEADDALEYGEDLRALTILSALVTAEPRDKELRTKYDALKQRLSSEKADELRTNLEGLFAAKRFEEMVIPLKELNQITPDAKFVSEMRKNLIDSFVRKGQDLASRQKFDDAEKIYTLALDLNPKDAKLQAALNETKEQKLLADIQNLQRKLSMAISSKQLVEQHRLAKELSRLDPGNYTAKSALESVNKAVALLMNDAEGARERGQFKQAAKIYKEIYDINGDQDIFALYDQYQKWAPPPGMSFLPVGSYRRGDRSTANARPSHKVTISNFYIDKFEVTNRQYYEFVKANPNWSPTRVSPDVHDGNYLKNWVGGQPKPDDLDRPVVYVSWFAASAYAQWKGKRLPTEAEWEKAARGNQDGTKFWWGDYSDAKKAVYDLYPERRPAPVGSFPPNAFDVFEILGNVNEWVEDTYDPKFYTKTRDAQDPVNDANGLEKVLRGGSYKSRGRELAAYLRYHKDPRFCHATVGFRCAQDAGEIH